MVVWRLAGKKYIRDLSGEGARIHGGRWNNKGTPVLYTSEHCSLALLELLANYSRELIPNDLFYLKLFIPDDLEIFAIQTTALPSNWKAYPAPLKITDRGTNLFNKKQKPVLKVPSVIVPLEFNILLNPLHPLFKKIEIIEAAPFSIDFRLED